MRIKNIPALFFAGMFFFSAQVSGTSLSLATDLFEKGEWELCKRECKRALLTQTKPLDKFQLLEAMSVEHTSAPGTALLLFEIIIATPADDQVSAIASYRAGRLYWQADRPEEALEAFIFSFNTTTNKDLFLHSACSVFLLFKEHHQLKTGHEGLIDQINTSREMWYGSLFKICEKPSPKTSQPKPPNWVIRFYRSQISPAIGERCTLEPSCSEYYHQANHKHGFKSVPMIADRLVREPGVNHKKHKPVVRPNGQIRYSDPIEDHDFWMKK